LRPLLNVKAPVEPLLRCALPRVLQVKAADERAKKRFGGMFETSHYVGLRDQAVEAEEEARRAQRAALTGGLRPHCVDSHHEASLLERWASSGVQVRVCGGVERESERVGRVSTLPLTRSILRR
jgi:hypothetical protein